MNRKVSLNLIVIVLLLIVTSRSNGQIVQPEWSKSATMYEVNLRQYSELGKIQLFVDQIPRLKELGIDVLWIMPIHPIGKINRKGTLGSYYSVQDYYAISPEYGTEDDFKTLVNVAHENGMKVLIDWVANHTAWDNQWIEEHPDWYVKNNKGEIQTQYDWTDVAKLNYDNREVHVEMAKAMKYWVEKFDIDGFRCDVAFLVPLSFWEYARTEIEKVKPIYMLAEMEWNTDITSSPNEYFNKAFNAAYGWNFMGVTHDYIKGKKTLSQLKSELKENYNKFPAYTHRLYYLTNHDENSWNGTVDEKYGANWQQIGVMVYTLPQSLPLIYTGEEVALNRRLSFFEKDPITEQEWQNESRRGWYQRMCTLKSDVKAFNSNSGDTNINEMDLNISKGNPNSILAYTRNAKKSSAYIFINFSSEPVEFSVNNLKLKKLKKYKIERNAEQTMNISSNSLVLQANSYMIFYK